MLNDKAFSFYSGYATEDSAEYCIVNRAGVVVATTKQYNNAELITALLNLNHRNNQRHFVKVTQ